MILVLHAITIMTSPRYLLTALWTGTLAVTCAWRPMKLAACSLNATSLSLVGVGTRWQVSVRIGRCRYALAGVGTRWQVSVCVGRCRYALAGVGMLWQVLACVGECYRVLCVNHECRVLSKYLCI